MNKNKLQSSAAKKIIFGVALIIVMSLLWGIGRQIADSLDAAKRLDQAVEHFNQLKEENNRLKKRYQEVQSDEYVEEVARNKLNLSRSNETIVMIPQEELDRAVGLYTPKVEASMPNWQKWLKLLIN